MQTPLHPYKLSSKPLNFNPQQSHNNPTHKHTQTREKMKLFFVVAAASLLIVAAHATFLEGDENPMRSGCRQQMKMMRPQLDQCERYMTMDLMDEEPMRRMSVRGREGCRSEDECKRGCCKAMREMDEECACEWMKSMVHQQRGEMGEEDMRMMRRKMRMMPAKCGMGHMSCPMGSGRRDFV